MKQQGTISYLKASINSALDTYFLIIFILNKLIQPQLLFGGLSMDVPFAIVPKI